MRQHNSRSVAHTLLLSLFALLCFIKAPEGKKLIVCDFSAIEARVLAWLADEEHILEVFKTHGKIYEASAAMMLKINIEDVTKEQRSKGKIAELALGYGGSKGALAKMGGEKMGLDNAEMRIIVNRWRKSNPNIVKFWGRVEKAALRTMKTKRPVIINGLEFLYNGSELTMRRGFKLFIFRNAFGFPMRIFLSTSNTS